MEKIKTNVERAFYERYKMANLTPISSKIEGRIITLKMMSIDDRVLCKTIILLERSDTRMNDAYISFSSHFIQSFKACRGDNIAVVGKQGKAIIFDQMLDKPIKSYDDFGDEVWTFVNHSR